MKSAYSKSKTKNLRFRPQLIAVIICIVLFSAVAPQPAKAVDFVSDLGNLVQTTATAIATAATQLAAEAQLALETAAWAITKVWQQQNIASINTGFQTLIEALNINADLNFRAAQAQIDADKRSAELNAAAGLAAASVPVTLSPGCATMKARQAMNRAASASASLGSYMAYLATSKGAGPKADTGAPAAAAKNVCDSVNLGFFENSTRYGQLGANLKCKK